MEDGVDWVRSFDVEYLGYWFGKFISTCPNCLNVPVCPASDGRSQSELDRDRRACRGWTGERTVFVVNVENLGKVPPHFFESQSIR